MTVLTLNRYYVEFDAPSFGYVALAFSEQEAIEKARNALIATLDASIKSGDVSVTEVPEE